MRRNSYGVGSYQSGEKHMAILPSNYVADGSRRGVYYCWGRSNTALNPLISGYWNDIAPELAEYGFPVITGDYGSTTHWGSPTARTRMDSLRTLGAGSYYGFKNDKVLLLGVSPGSLLNLNWARAHLSSVAAIALITP